MAEDLGLGLSRLIGNRPVDLNIKKSSSDGLLAICFQSRLDNVGLVVALLIGFYVRAHFIDQPMRFDEASTFNLFINHDWTQVFSYLAPNNHVLHTILVKLSTIGLGNDPAAMRIPAFAFGTLSIVLIFCVTRMLGGAGSFAALITATQPYLILFSTNARGYSLLVFFVLALVALGYVAALRPHLVKTIGFALVAALGLLVMPTMAFPLAGIYCWVIWVANKNGIFFKEFFTRQWLPCGFEVILLTGLLYTPVVLQTGLESIVSNEYVSAGSLDAFLKGLRWHLESTIRQFLRDLPWAYSLLLGVVTFFGVYKAYRTSGNHIASLILSCVVSAALLLLLKLRIPFDRTWIYFIPLLLIATDYGINAVLCRSSNKLRRVFYVLGVTTAIGLAGQLTRTATILQNDETGIFPAGPVVGKYLATHMKNGDGLFIECCENYPLFYYLTLYGAQSYTYSPETRHQDNYYVVPKGKLLKTISDRTPELVFETDGTKIYFESKN
jgi:hypothetical protein